MNINKKMNSNRKQSKFFLTLGYFGLFIFLKFTLKFLYLFFRRRKALDKYMVNNKSLPLEIKQEKQINYILFNWDAHEHNQQLCNNLINIGYRIIFLISKDELEVIKNKNMQGYTLDAKHFTYIMYDSSWDDFAFSSEISNELDHYNLINNHLCIYINKFQENLELTKQVNLLRLVMSKMLRKKGSSLVMSLNSNRFPEEFLLDHLYEILSKEYAPKIDFLNIRTSSNNLECLNSLNINQIDFAKSNLFIK
jgi:hypothetical protein